MHHGSYSFFEWGDLTNMIDSSADHVVPLDARTFQQLAEERVWPLEAEEYITWGFLAPDYSTLSQLREQNGEFVETGLQVVYDNEGLAQPPRQVTM